ncbi:hypothetical protein AKO1_009406, partial [Acrasis kona]
MFDAIDQMVDLYSQPQEPVVEKETEFFEDSSVVVRILSFVFESKTKFQNTYGKVCTQWQNIATSMNDISKWYKKKIVPLINKQIQSTNDEEQDESNAFTTNIDAFELPKQFFMMPFEKSHPLVASSDQRVDLVFIFPHSLTISIYKQLVEATNVLHDHSQRKQILSRSRFRDGFLRDDLFEHEQEQDLTEIDSKNPFRVPDNLYPLIQSIQEDNLIIILNHGGYFATTLFDARGKQIHHKTFHKYVSRKKQGKRQVTQDKSKKAKSMGSQIRRQQEDDFKEEVQEHLCEWSDHYKKCQLIFVHAPGPYNESLLFDDESPLQNKQCYSIPFNTQQPTNTQVLSAFNKLF